MPWTQHPGLPLVFAALSRGRVRYRALSATLAAAAYTFVHFPQRARECSAHYTNQYDCNVLVSSLAPPPAAGTTTMCGKEVHACTRGGSSTRLPHACAACSEPGSRVTWQQSMQQCLPRSPPPSCAKEAAGAPGARRPSANARQPMHQSPPRQPLCHLAGAGNEEECNARANDPTPGLAGAKRACGGLPAIAGVRVH